MEKTLTGLREKRGLVRAAIAVGIFWGSLLLLFGPAAAQETPKYGGTFVVAMGQDPANLNPATTNSFYTKIVSATMYNTLVNLDFDLNPVPRLAKSWEISADNKTYTFQLVDTKWHDGKPFTSEDVKFSFEEMLMKNHPGGQDWKDKIKEIRTPGPRTVVFELKTPFAPFFFKNAYDSYILPKHLFQGADVLKNPYTMKPVGTGAFKFVEWVKGSHIRVERNPNYFIPNLPYVDSIVFKIVPDIGARMMAFERGEIDYLPFYIVSPSEVPRLKKMADVGIASKGHEIFGDILLMLMNMDNPPLNKLAVRRAIAHSVDKQYIIDKADFGMGKVAAGPITSTVSWAYTPDVPKYPYSVETANKLLDEAGYPKKADGMRFRLVARYDRAVALFSKTAEIIREQFRPVGIDLELNPGDIATTLDLVYKQRKFDFFIYGTPGGGDPAVRLNNRYSSSNIRPLPWTNGSGYRNPEVDKLLDRGDSLTDQKERSRIYKQVVQIVLTDLPEICIEEYAQNSAWRGEYKGLHTWSALSNYTLDNVWWTKGKSK